MDARSIHDQPPDPDGAGTAAELLRCMTALRQWAGRPSLRRLRQLGGQIRSTGGDLVDALPPSTVSHLLRGEQMPRFDFVEAFVRACLHARETPPERIAAELGRWRTAWRRIAPAPAEPSSSKPAVEPGRPPAGAQQLPPDIAEFTGRTAELRVLAVWAAGRPATPGVTPIALIEGMGGVGKTRLAVHFAHSLLAGGRYDRVLHADLRGFGGDEAPAEPAVLLDGLLRTLGIPGGDIPYDLAGRSALLRDWLHDSSTLVLLDDAARVEQVMPLVPTGPGSLVLVTSRRSLAVDGSLTVRLRPFRDEESADLLARLAGPARIDADPVGTLRVTHYCGNLPLAVALAGRRLHARDAWTVGELAGRLLDLDRRLVELVLGGRAVDAVFSLSYQALTGDQRRLFRLLAVHPGSVFCAPSVAALTGCTGRQASAMLESLVDEHLLVQPEAHRYAMHDLLRAYARERLAAEEPPADQERARGAVLRWYRATMTRADRLIDPHHPGRVSRARVTGTAARAAPAWWRCRASW